MNNSGEASFDLVYSPSLTTTWIPLKLTTLICPQHNPYTLSSLLRLGCCLRHIVMIWVPLTPHQASHWHYIINLKCIVYWWLITLHFHLFFLTDCLFPLHMIHECRSFMQGEREMERERDSELMPHHWHPLHHYTPRHMWMGVVAFHLQDHHSANETANDLANSNQKNTMCKQIPHWYCGLGM